jgi:hypothetical protein
MADMLKILKTQNCSSNGDLCQILCLYHFMWVDNDVPNWFPTLKNFYRSPFSKIQHCPISSKFDMWVDNDVPNWLLTLKLFNVGNQFGTSLSTHISNFDNIGKCWILLPIFYAVFWKCRIAPLMVRQISGTTGQNFMKLGGVIDICF